MLQRLCVGNEFPRRAKRPVRLRIAAGPDEDIIWGFPPLSQSGAHYFQILFNHPPPEPWSQTKKRNGHYVFRCCCSLFTALPPGSLGLLDDPACSPARWTAQKEEACRPLEMVAQLSVLSALFEDTTSRCPRTIVLQVDRPWSSVCRNSCISRSCRNHLSNVQSLSEPSVLFAYRSWVFIERISYFLSKSTFK